MRTRKFLIHIFLWSKTIHVSFRSRSLTVKDHRPASCSPNIEAFCDRLPKQNTNLFLSQSLNCNFHVKHFWMDQAPFMTHLLEIMRREPEVALRAGSCTVDRKLHCGQEVALWTESCTVDRKFNWGQEVAMWTGSCTVDRKLYCGQEV